MEEIKNQNKALAIYLMEHKELRLLQNVRNFINTPYLLKADGYNIEKQEYENLTDTFYD